MDVTKSSDCIIQHLNFYRRQARKKERADFSEPCRHCPYNKECDFDWHENVKFALPETSIKLEILPETPEILQAIKDIDTVVEDKEIAKQLKNILCK